MNRRRFVAACGALLAAATATARAQEFREIPWDDLVPKGWDPLKPFRDNKNLGRLQDGDPEAVKMMSRLREIWDNAPTVEALDNAAIKLPGYVVPLEQSKGDLKEFLLVPYFGACIHTPPPPANQIVHVVVAAPVRGFRAMETVWVSGTLKSFRRDSSMGTSGYRLDAATVEPYEHATR